MKYTGSYSEVVADCTCSSGVNTERLKYRKSSLVLFSICNYYNLNQHTKLNNVTHKHHTVVMITVKV